MDYLEQVNKYKPPTYGGQEDPTKLESWIETMDKLVTAVRCPQERMVEVATFYLTGIATTWKRSLEIQPNDWEELQALLRERFYPLSIKNAKYVEFVTLEQGNMTV